MDNNFILKYKHWFLVYILVITFLLRLPSLFEPYWYGDEGITLTMGQVWRSGLILYRDIHDNKPPLLYILAGVANNLFWFKFILTYWVLATIGIFWGLIWQINKRLLITPWLNIISTAIFALLITIPYWEGNLANGEIFMLAPIMVGMYLVIINIPNDDQHLAAKITNLKILTLFNQLLTRKDKTSTSKIEQIWLYLAGICFGIGFLFKQPAVFDFISGLLFLSYLIRRKNFLASGYIFFTKTTILSLGFITPVALAAVYFLLHNAGFDFIRDVFLNNFFYISVWEPESKWGSTIAFGGSLQQRFIVLIMLCAGIWLIRNKIKKTVLLILLWFVLSLFGALLSGRPYPHYLLQVVPTLCIFIGWFIAGLNNLEFNKSLADIKRPTIIIPLFCFMLFYLSWARIGFGNYPTRNYYKNFYDYITGHKSSESYYQWFNLRVSNTYQLAAWLKFHTSSSDEVFIWGDDTMIYPLANKIPPVSYIAAYHINQFNVQPIVISELKNDPPEYIIKLHSAPDSFPQLDGFILQQYRLMGVLGEADVYKNIESLVLNIPPQDYY